MIGPASCPLYPEACRRSCLSLSSAASRVFCSLVLPSGSTVTVISVEWDILAPAFGFCPVTAPDATGEPFAST